VDAGWDGAQRTVGTLGWFVLPDLRRGGGFVFKWLGELERLRQGSSLGLFTGLLSMTRSQPFRIQKPAQLEALKSPARMEILSAVDGLGDCTAAELASALGRTQSSLYFHLGKLAKVGLLLRKEGERGAIFRTPPGSLELGYDPHDARHLSSMLEGAAAILRAAERALRSALESGAARVRGSRRDTTLQSQRAFLGADELRAVNEHVNEIERIFDQAKGARAGRLVSFTACLAPVAPKEQRRP
jgi:DNA-binding transcriptional ArsR family regulator